MSKEITLRQMVQELGLEVRAGAGLLDRPVSGGYTSDLLSDVMAHGEPGRAWITLQIHQNVVAVANLKELACIILANGRVPDADTLEKAEAEEVPVLVSQLSAFELSGRLWRFFDSAP